MPQRWAGVVCRLTENKTRAKDGAYRSETMQSEDMIREAHLDAADDADVHMNDMIARECMVCGYYFEQPRKSEHATCIDCASKDKRKALADATFDVDPYGCVMSVLRSDSIIGDRMRVYVGIALEKAHKRDSRPSTITELDTLVKLARNAYADLVAEDLA